MIFGLILAGGVGSRMGADKPKQYLEIGDKPIIVHTIERFIEYESFEKIIVLCPDEWIGYTRDIIKDKCENKKAADIEIITGGDSRNETIMNGIAYIEEHYGVDDDTIIVTHDAARPFINTRIISENVGKTLEYGAATTAIPAVETGTKTLKDAVNECMREWTNRVDDTLYVLGSVMGPHPFPTIVRDFQSVISREARAQILEKEGRLPDVVMACVGGGSNSMGMFYEFINDKDVKLIGCEAAGLGVDTDKTAATMATGTEGIFHGMKSYFCQDEYGQIAPVYSISAGLDYPGVGPEHAYLKDIGRAEYVPVTDEEAVNAFEYIAKEEGIIAAIESSHAVAHVMKIAPKMDKDQIIICCLSGRGDKDVAAIARYRGIDLHE